MHIGFLTLCMWLITAFRFPLGISSPGMSCASVGNLLPVLGLGFFVCKMEMKGQMICVSLANFPLLLYIEQVSPGRRIVTHCFSPHWPASRIHEPVGLTNDHLPSTFCVFLPTPSPQYKALCFQEGARSFTPTSADIAPLTDIKAMVRANLTAPFSSKRNLTKDSSA